MSIKFRGSYSHCEHNYKNISQEETLANTFIKLEWKLVIENINN